MRTIIGAVAILVLAGAAAVAQDKDKIDPAKLVGKWEPKEPKKGEEMVMEFTKDGKLIASGKLGGMDLKIEGTYKVDGNKVMMKMKFMDIEIEETVTITKLTDDEMVGKGSKEEKEEAFKRVKEKKEEKK